MQMTVKQIIKAAAAIITITTNTAKKKHNIEYCYFLTFTYCPIVGLLNRLFQIVLQEQDDHNLYTGR